MDKLVFIVWDVQHGSAAYVRTPNGKNIVIDLGTGDATGGNEAFSPLMYLKSKGISTIDLLIITHPHTDHIDDILNIDLLKVNSLHYVRCLSEKDVQAANQSTDKYKVDKYFEFINRFNQTVGPNSNVMLSENNGGVTIQTFFPFDSAQNNINNNSLVTTFEYLGAKIIVPGDNESTSWNALLQKPKFIDAIYGADILIASHHGRESGYSENIFNHFAPYITIASDGSAGETSVTDKYSNKAIGFEVKSRSEKSSKDRYCLTTRNDGTIEIEIYQKGANTWLSITKE